MSKNYSKVYLKNYYSDPEKGPDVDEKVYQNRLTIALVAILAIVLLVIIHQ